MAKDPENIGGTWDEDKQIANSRTQRKTMVEGVGWGEGGQRGLSANKKSTLYSPVGLGFQFIWNLGMFVFEMRGQ